MAPGDSAARGSGGESRAGGAREEVRSGGAGGPGAGGPAAGGGAASDLADFYTRGYAAADAEEGLRLGRWRALGAAVKAGHVERLLGGAVSTLVEIGCGDGALLEELGRRGVARTLDGFELSPTAAALAQQREIPGLRTVAAYDGRTIPAADGAYDLAVVSHVLEHVPDPAALVHEAGRVARQVLVEVPLEDNRSARRPSVRAQALGIGHIQAFNRADIRALAEGAGLRVVAELSDPLPRAHHAFFAETPAQRARAVAVHAVKGLVHRAAPHAAERLFTVHYAALLAHR